MKFSNKIHLLFWVIFFPLWCHAQTPTHAGYFIDNQGRRVDCQIELQGWLLNPVDFRYRLPGEEQLRTAVMDSVQAFAVGDYFFERHQVRIDRMLDTILGKDRVVKLQTEVLFLRKIASGTPALYAYHSTNLERFFIGDGQEPVQLQYRRWKNEEGDLRIDRGYQSQLMQLAPIPDMDIAKFSKIAYRMDDLRRYMQRYYQATGQVVAEKARVYRDWFHVSAFAGVLGQQLQVTTFLGERMRTSQLGWTMGLGMEIVLPFHRNRLSVLVEPSWVSGLDTQFGDENSHPAWYKDNHSFVKVGYHRVIMPVQLRYTLTPRPGLRLFAQAGVEYSQPLGSSHVDIKFPKGGGHSADLRGIYLNPTFGVGAAYGRMYMDLRYTYYPALTPLDNYANLSIKTFSARVGYRLF